MATPDVILGDTVPAPKAETVQSGCQLYATITCGPAARERLTAVLDAGVVTSVLIRSASSGRLSAGEVKPLVELIQARNVAALIEGDAQLARTARADGVHLAHSADCLAAYAAARAILGERFIVGADAGQSRHDAMSLAEAGADYVGFGITSPLPSADDAPQSRDDLIGWWASLFEIPCVAFDVASVEEAKTLADLGTDFAAFAIAPGMTPAAAQAFAASMAAAVGAVTA